MRNETGDQICFDDFAIDASRRVLLKGGQPVALNPKALDLLLVLTERPGVVLSKQDLLDAVWGEQFVEEKNLTVHVAALRKIFGERKDENRFIATIPGTGYKFVAAINAPVESELVLESRTVKRIVVEEEFEHEDPKQLREKGRSIARSLTLYALPITLFVVLGGFAWQSRQKPAGENQPVLSFKRLTTNGQVTLAALSPDANFYVYAVAQEGKTSLWLGQMTGGESLQLRPPAAGTRYRSIRFSPDGGSILYVVNDERNPQGELFKQSLFSGVPEKLRDRVDHVAFSPDASQIVFVRNDEKLGTSSLVVSGIGSTSEREFATRPIAQRFAPYSLAWSPDGSGVAVAAFAADGRSFDFYVVAIAGSTVTRLTNAAWNSVRAAVWESDGKGLIVQADERSSGTSSWQIYEIAYPQGTVRRLINDLNSYNSSLSISADGNQLLAIQGQTIGNIWTSPADDLKAAKQITFGSIGELNGWWGLAWTPNDEIVYTRFFDRLRTIWKMEASGAGQKQLIPPGGENFYPSITSDGRFVVFQSTRDGKNGVWRTNSDGSDLRLLTAVDTAGQPRVSPDGKWIVYTAGPESAGNLYRISIDGGEPTRLTEADAGWAEFSPDSKFIACQFKSGDEAKLAIIPIDGTADVEFFDIPPTANFRLGVKWFPDGKAVAYRDWEKGLWKQPLDGGKPERMSNLPDEKLYSFDWSKDGKRFAFVRGQEIRDVILISNFRQRGY